MKIKQMQIIEKYVKLKIYPSGAPAIITHIDIPENAIVDRIEIYANPPITTWVGMGTSLGTSNSREFTCSDTAPCIDYIPLIEITGLFNYGGDKEVFNTRITHIWAQAMSSSSDVYSILLIRLLCRGECTPNIWIERRSIQ